MKLLLPLLLAPVLSLAATIGSVTLLDGTPVSGAVIKSLTDSVTTSANGSFALGRTSGIASRSAKSIPVTSHLTVENGSPRLTFAGMDIAGRARSSAIARQNLSSTGSNFAARSTGTPDTLKVYWKGKRLTVLPVTSDTTVTFRIDTAWKDDAGIPWNPAITYGSLYDARDGQTYRTVTIGTQTWMAENLNYALGGASILGCDEFTTTLKWCYSSNSILYTWAQAMGIDTSYNHKFWSGESQQGICPVSWHVPSNQDWSTLIPIDTITFITDGLDSSKTYSFAINTTASKWLRSTSGWLNPGNDWLGFRILPIEGTIVDGLGTTYRESLSRHWSSSQIAADAAGLQLLMDTISVSFRSNSALKSSNSSLRCLKD